MRISRTYEEALVGDMMSLSRRLDSKSLKVQRWHNKNHRQQHQPITFHGVFMASHTVLLRSDGLAVACGNNRDGQCDIPALEAGLLYTQVSTGPDHTVLLRSDGCAVACGQNEFGQCDIPPLDEGMSYTQVSAGTYHTVLLRSDGHAVACGDNYDDQCTVPSLPEGISYTAVSAGGRHTTLLRSDGRVVGNRQMDGVDFASVSNGRCHSLFLRNDGSVLGHGGNVYGECNIPPLEKDTKYTQLAAGYDHTVLLRSDGRVVACGGNGHGQCNIRLLDDGMSYTQIIAGKYHTVLVRSDGSAITCGSNHHGQCNIPSPEPGTFYIGHHIPHVGDHVFQLECLFESNDFVTLTCSTLVGEEKLRWKVESSDQAWEIQKHIAHHLQIGLQGIQVVLPDGRLLQSLCRTNPVATVMDVGAKDARKGKKARIASDVPGKQPG